MGCDMAQWLTLTLTGAKGPGGPSKGKWLRSQRPTIDRVHARGYGQGEAIVQHAPWQSMRNFITPELRCISE